MATRRPKRSSATMGYECPACGRREARGTNRPAPRCYCNPPAPYRMTADSVRDAVNAVLRRRDAARSAADMDRDARKDAERAEGVIAARNGYRLTARDESTRSRAWLDGYYDCARKER